MGIAAIFWIFDASYIKYPTMLFSCHTTFKLLGVFIQCDLKWDTHVNEIVSKGNSRLFILQKLKFHGLSSSDLLTIYLSSVRFSP
ncbi:hypothetical protein HOLleu_40985 [Holothuria leucospilota]|uniref:Uncharacterized protein n=1 Tax=Holothuria leucospilota TaxID=206669 RepID=A0A9Q0YDB6_HOLLE|nr:hypothetical protein HOLleu_40985 [Holothuria leucospilota]